MATPKIEIDTLYDELLAHLQPKNSRRLLVSALESFAAHGFAASTTREIAERAGMSPAGLYVHYRSKAELLFEVIRIGHERVLDGLVATANHPGSATERLRACVQSFVAWHAHFHTLARVCQYELTALDGARMATISQLRRRIQQQMEDIISSGIESHEFEVSDLRGATRAILSLGIDVARWFDDDGPVSPDVLALFYSDLAMRMVGA